MNKMAYVYNSKQSEEIENYICSKFNGDVAVIAHEIKSEYVHTDTMVLADDGNSRTFVTFGMGARKMDTPLGNKRCELVMSTSKDIDVKSKEAFIIAGELARISKYPFKEETWFGTGHTFNASKEFKETFGFEYFAFWKMPFCANLTGIKEDIEFFFLFPIYEEERQWCVNNHTLALLDRLHKMYDSEQGNVDFKRDVLIPEDLDEDEMYDYNTMLHLDIDSSTYYSLCEYLANCNKEGKDISYEDIENWIIKHKYR